MYEDGKPGCYGSPLCYQENGNPCGVCNYRSDCKVASAERAVALSRRFGLHGAMGAAAKPVRGVSTSIMPPVAKPLPAEKPVETKSVVRTAPFAPSLSETSEKPNKKALEIAERIRERGIDLKKALNEGVNPFQFNPPAFLRVAMRMLLEGKSLEKTAYKDELVKGLQWSDATAASHAAIAFSVLDMMGIDVSNPFVKQDAE